VCEKIDHGITDWIRLGCTDPTWQDPACLSVCLHNGGGGLGVRPCDGMAGDRYCCDYVPGDPGNMSCCQDSANIFQWKAASVIATMPLSQISGSATLKTASTTNTTSPPSTISVTTTALPSPTSTDGAHATSTNSQAAATSNSDSGLTSGAKAGIGIGVSVGCVALLAGLIFLIFRRGQRRGAGNDATPAIPSQIPYYTSQRALSPAELSPQERLQEVSGHPIPVVQKYAAELDPLAGVHELDGSQQRKPC
jgi:hypothetical protein